MHGGQLHLSASLDGHCGNMKSWRCVTCLLLFVLLVDLSMEGCYDNFNLTKLTAENLSRVITLKIPKDKPDLKDIINSSLMDKDAPEYQIYDDCIDSDEIKHTINVTSQEGSSHNISYYLFLCLMARAFSVPPEYIVGCEYELLCEHICNKSATDKTTAATTTTMATTSSDTTAATTTTMATTSSDTTAATTTTMATTSSDTTRRLGKLQCMVLCHQTGICQTNLSSSWKSFYLSTRNIRLIFTTCP
uniref:uncharacterized protein LOC109951439 n=1 Tax=Monopterus albus TaxID=43700 RepID=UPI0009B3BD09|nr:uncharacterized protein LOC109951439 [Monopterus albus]